MRVIESVDEMLATRSGLTESVGIVPTMGYLHAGHLSLAAAARRENAAVIASIFVNPAQFGPGEDLSRYPRDLPRDLALLEAAGVDVVFAPSADEMYPAGYATYVAPVGPLAERLEAASRPGHFRGVCTVVLKLLNITRPGRAYFGQKDAQQVAVLRHMVVDLNVPTALRVLPTMREADGLAMSSRNAYLTGEDRAAATVLSRALRAGREAFEAHASSADDTGPVLAAMRAPFAAEPRATLDYVDISDPDSFEPLAVLRAPALLSLAARVGPARLIDNVLLRADGTWDTGTPAL